MKKKAAQPVSLSVIIPAYNAAPWLPKTIPRVAEAVKQAGIKKAEIIVVDDGSKDDTAQVAEGLKADYPIRVITQKNGGRFVARKTGTSQAKYDFVLFIDTRIYIAPKGLQFIVEEMKKHPERQVWTSHVYLDKKANRYAQFWDAITSLAWRKYFSNPRDYSYGIPEFDHFPKGTTCFFVPTKAIKAANTWFEKNTNNLKYSNDDTLLIRHIAERQNININPKFYCTYHARTSFKQHAKHVFHRGRVFVDGFLRRDGNRFFWPLITFLTLSICVPILLIFMPQFILPLVLLLLGIWLLEMPIAWLLGIPFEDAWNLTILTPVFVVFYTIGIWSGFINIFVYRKT